MGGVYLDLFFREAGKGGKHGTSIPELGAGGGGHARRPDGCGFQRSRPSGEVRAAATFRVRQNGREGLTEERAHRNAARKKDT